MQQTRQAAEGGENKRAAVELSETGLATAALDPAGRIETQAAEGGRERVEAVVETLAHLHGEGDSLAAVAHDTRNMVTALELYCDLLEEPGVLTPAFHHYASELKLVATSSHRLVEKLLALDLRLGPVADLSRHVGAGWLAAARDAGLQDQARGWDLMPAGLIDNLAGEVLASRNLLTALAGPAIALTVDAVGGAQPVRMSGEDLTRILVNLVRNAAEAMPGGGRIQIGLREASAATGATRSLTLTVEDNGRGIPGNALEKIFESGYTTSITENGLPASHHGLGLAITRSIVEAAGGHIQAFRREPAGVRFEIELPIRSR
jgi:signal transduction histidine kinase